MSGKHTVTLRQTGKGGHTWTATLDGDDEVTGGVGGWDAEQAGKSKRPVMRWAGVQGYQITIPLTLDQTATNGSVESACRRLTQLGRPPKGRIRPKPLRLAGLLRVPTHLSWVITGIEWGEQIRRSDGRRTYQEISLTLSEYHLAPAKKAPADRHRDEDDDDTDEDDE